MIVRVASTDDATAIAGLAVDAGIDGWSTEDVRAELDRAGSYVWVAFEVRVIGFAIFRSVLDESELLAIGVLGARRRQGIGRALLEVALAALREAGITQIHLEVRADNDGARRLYESFGFQLVTVRKRYYRNGDDACIYVDRLVP